MKPASFFPRGLGLVLVATEKPGAVRSQVAAIPGTPARAVVDQYCVTCHTVVISAA
jgi:hypothetical protein